MRTCSAAKTWCSLLLAVALGGACAGKTGGGSGDAGGSKVDGSAGPTCQPLPGCSSTTDCPAGDGCNGCRCDRGIWLCSLLGCPDAASSPGDGSAEGSDDATQAPDAQCAQIACDAGE